MADSHFSLTLCRFIADAFLGDGSRVQRDTPLLELNILDSAALFDVVDYIRQEFGVQIPVADIHPEHFANVAQLEALVLRLNPLEKIA
ncbi:acyl carrier protein [Paucibacter aquatile]|uniref:Acyl carrier protein n=1 Tax=Kinneretia aquatilis TaxID=2070761 RepID=A0A2N8KTR9_9BURK|nr:MULTISPECIES: acyl carrier protein [Roseateles]PND36846.1 acyl carrier protein [Paucibacter aquatile]